MRDAWRLSSIRPWFLALGVLSATALGPAEVSAEPGTDTYRQGGSEIEYGSLAPIITESGPITLSVDGSGSNGGAYQFRGGAPMTLRVQKPAGATVRRAFLAAATTGFSGRKLGNGEVSLDGMGVTWQISTTSSISSWNHWAEVTSIVKPKLDAAAAGLVTFNVGEVNPTGIDGEVLAVIFDDPAQTTTNTVILLFGAQNIAGDTFNIALGSPINKADPDLAIDFSLGISFGFQAASGVQAQRSLVNVNGVRLTSIAGGQDDGSGTNGALLTVGGIGDTNANPPPLTTSGNPRTDDELYSLLPLVADGATAITVFSQNPSNDDNIFFAALNLRAAAAIVGEGIVLGPSPAPDSDTGTPFTVTAKVQNDNGQPIANRLVTFTAFAGPHAGTTGTALTNASGNASFTYTGTAAGVDEIKATFVDSQNNVQTSNTVIKRWILSNHAPVAICQDVTRAVDAACVAHVQPAEIGGMSFDDDGDPLSFALNPGGPFALGDTGVTMTVTDIANTSDACTAVVTAIDEAAPTVACPAPLSAECTGGTSAPVNVPNATGADNCGNPAIAGPAGTATYPLGSTALTFTATDGSGNAASCTTTVTVSDTAGPSLTCASPLVAECTGNHAATVDVPNASGSDACSPVDVTGPAGPASYPIGTTSLDFTGTDSSGNSAACSTSVTVVDTAAPDLACPAPVVAECTGNTSAVIDLPNAIATDVCGGATVSGPAGPASYPLGSTAVGFSAADDAGNTADCATSVTVVDTIAPALACPAPIVAECTGNHAADVDVPNATGGDACSAVDVTGPAGTNSYPIGTTTIDFTGTDVTGNTAVCDSTVTVVDTTAPAIACPAPIVAECTGNGAATVDVPNATASDVCGGAIVTGPAGPGTYPLGTTTIGFGTTDDYGNLAFCTTSVTVGDSTAPVFDPATLEPRTVAGACDGSSISITPPTATDACQDVTVTCTQVPGTAGTHASTCTATDASGNVTTATIQVTVLAPLLVKFQAPLWDDNEGDDIETDADSTNIFQVGSAIPNKVQIYTCDCTDITKSIASSVTVRLAVKYRDDANPGSSTPIDPIYQGTGGPNGQLVLRGNHFHYNQKTVPGTYPTGTWWNSHYYQNVVSVTYNSAPNVVVAQEDVRLETP